MTVKEEASFSEVFRMFKSEVIAVSTEVVVYRAVKGQKKKEIHNG